MNEKEFSRFEYAIGTYILQVVGSIILLLGVGFFLKYSVDQGWLTPSARVLLGLGLGTGLLLLGQIWRTRYHIWGWGCSAGGIALYYLSLYAAHSLYNLIPAPVTFGVFVTISLLAAWMSMRYNSSIIAGLSLLGGCAAPLVIHAYTAPMLAAYLVVIAVTFSLIAAIKQWHWIPLISFCFLSYYYAIFFQFHLPEFSRSLYLIAFFYLYTLPYYYGLRRSYISSLYEILSVFFAGIFSIYAWYAIAVSKFSALSVQDVFVHVASISGLFYALYVWWLVRKNRANTPLLATILGLFVGCFFAAIITKWSGYEQSIVLHILGLALFLYSVRIEEPLLRLGSYALWLFSSIHMVRLLYTAAMPTSLIFNSIHLSVVIIAAVFLIAAHYVSRIQRFAYKEKIWLYPALIVGAVLAPFYWLCTPVWKTSYAIIGFLFYALILFLMGGIARYKLLRQCAYWCGSFALIYLGIYYVLGNVMHPYYWLKLTLLFVSAIVTFSSAYVYLHYNKAAFTLYEQTILPKVFRLGIAIFMYIWLRVTIIISFDYVQQPGFALARIWGDYDSTTKLIRTHFTNIMLTMYYTLYALIIMSVGLVFSDTLLRYLGLLLVFIAVGKLGSMIMIMPNTTHRILAFIFVGLLLIAGSFAYQRLSRKK